MSIKDYIFLFLIFCVLGAGLEWGYGMLWSVIGTTPWLYPDSPLRYTSLEVLPHWGFGGLVGVSVYRAFRGKNARFLLAAIPSLILAVLWILIYTWFIV